MESELFDSMEQQQKLSNQSKILAKIVGEIAMLAGVQQCAKAWPNISLTESKKNFHDRKIAKLRTL